MEAYFDRLAPENAAYYKHTIEAAPTTCPPI